MFLPCRPCCGGGGPCSGEYPDSVEIDIDYIGYKTNTSLSFPSMGTGLNPATTWYDTLQLAVHPIGGTQLIYASVANYAILNHLDGTFVLTQGATGVYTYTDPSGFVLKLVMDMPTASTFRLQLTLNGGPEVRTLHKYSATPETESNMAAASWKTGATNCTPSLANAGTAYHPIYGNAYTKIPYTGSNSYSHVGPAWNALARTDCENISGFWPQVTATEACNNLGNISEVRSANAAFDQAQPIASGTGIVVANPGLDFTAGVFFDTALPINWTAYSAFLSNHQYNIYYPNPAAPEVWTDGGGQQWLVTYGIAGPLGVGLNGSSKDNHIATRHQVTRIQGIYGGVPVDLFSRA